jgi:2'-5' RNA ligase
VASIGRVFFAVDLDAESRAAIATQLQDLEMPGKPVPPQNWHLTLRYVKSIDEVAFDRLLAAVDQLERGETFRVAFTDPGAFPNARRATVLWRGVSDPGDRLAALAADIETACQEVGLRAEDRPYRAHLTLARIRPAEDVRPLMDLEIAPVPLHVDHITLFRSHLGGPNARYEPLETFDLR